MVNGVLWPMGEIDVFRFLHELHLVGYTRGGRFVFVQFGVFICFASTACEAEIVPLCQGKFAVWIHTADLPSVLPGGAHALVGRVIDSTYPGKADWFAVFVDGQMVVLPFFASHSDHFLVVYCRSKLLRLGPLYIIGPRRWLPGGGGALSE